MEVTDNVVLPKNQYLFVRRLRFNLSLNQGDMVLGRKQTHLFSQVYRTSRVKQQEQNHAVSVAESKFSARCSAVWRHPTSHQGVAQEGWCLMHFPRHYCWSRPSQIASLLMRIFAFYARICFYVSSVAASYSIGKLGCTCWMPTLPSSHTGDALWNSPKQHRLMLSGELSPRGGCPCGLLLFCLLVGR